MKTAIGAGLAAVLLLPLLLIVMLAPSAASSSGCAVTSAGGPVAGPWEGLDTEQIQNAEIGAAVVKARPWPAADISRAIVIVEMTARQESGLHNVDHGDTAGPDSRGVLQQRASWGSLADRMNPVKAFGFFLDRLANVDGWQTMPPQHAAHLVQVNQNEDDYTKWIPWAEQVAVALSGSDGGVTVQCDAAATPGGGTGTGNNVAGQTTIPAGMVLSGTPAGRQALAFAMQQLGKPYVFGAAGPNSFDCSGLTMAAWASAGVSLPHFTVTQAQAGTPEPADLSAAVTGDLVFIPGSDGTAAAPGHVGMIGGKTPDNHLWLIQAPMTGIPIEFTDTSEWAGQITAVRHIG